MTAVLHPADRGAADPEPVDDATEDARRITAAVAMAWSVTAGVIHLLVAPSHFSEARWLGVGFVVVGVAQLVLAGLLLRPLPTWTAVLAAVANAGAAGFYVATRTVDLWFMPAHGPGHEVGHLPVAGGIGNGIPIYPGDRIEPVGPLDLTCLVAELVVVAMLLVMLPAGIRSRLGSALAAAALAGTAVVLAIT